MFFDDISQIPSIASCTGFSIFCLPSDLYLPNPNLKKQPSIAEKLGLKTALIVEPNSKNQIVVDQIKDLVDLCKTKQTSDFFVVISNAETMNEKAQNAFLKLLEEPSDNYHFVLLVDNASSLLETVLSRGEIYMLKTPFDLTKLAESDETVKTYAKSLLAATPQQLSSVMKSITEDKIYKRTDNARPFTLKIVSTAVEMCYKSYLKTKNPNFIIKLKKLIVLYENIKQNGHIKLHLVADLL